MRQPLKSNVVSFHDTAQTIAPRIVFIFLAAIVIIVPAVFSPWTVESGRIKLLVLHLSVAAMLALIALVAAWSGKLRLEIVLTVTRKPSNGWEWAGLYLNVIWPWTENLWTSRVSDDARYAVVRVPRSDSKSPWAEYKLAPGYGEKMNPPKALKLLEWLFGGSLDDLWWSNELTSEYEEIKTKVSYKGCELQHDSRLIILEKLLGIGLRDIKDYEMQNIETAVRIIFDIWWATGNPDDRQNIISAAGFLALAQLGRVFVREGDGDAYFQKNLNQNPFIVVPSLTVAPLDDKQLNPDNYLEWPRLIKLAGTIVHEGTHLLQFHNIQSFYFKKIPNDRESEEEAYRAQINFYNSVYDNIPAFDIDINQMEGVKLKIRRLIMEAEENLEIILNED